MKDKFIRRKRDLIISDAPNEGISDKQRENAKKFIERNLKTKESHYAGNIIDNPELLNTF